MIRVLQHNSDADARIVALLMSKLGIDEITITHEDEKAMSEAIAGHCIVAGGQMDGSMQIAVMPESELPREDEVFQ